MRRLLVIGTNSVVIKRHVHKAAQPGTWFAGMLSRKPTMLVRVALANNEPLCAIGPSPMASARIVWALMAKGAVYQSPVAAA